MKFLITGLVVIFSLHGKAQNCPFPSTGEVQTQKSGGRILTDILQPYFPNLKFDPDSWNRGISGSGNYISLMDGTVLSVLGPFVVRPSDIVDDAGNVIACKISLISREQYGENLRITKLRNVKSGHYVVPPETILLQGTELVLGTYPYNDLQ